MALGSCPPKPEPNYGRSISVAKFSFSLRMSRLLQSAVRATSRHKTLTAAASTAAAPAAAAAFDSNLLRLLRSELTYLSAHHPPRPPPETFAPFWIDDRPGQQWLRLLSHHADGREEVKLDATMFDAAVPPDPRQGYEGDFRRHITLVVEVSKFDASDAVMAFLCSAWPEYIQVNNVFPVRRRAALVRPYMGRDFKRLDRRVQDAVYEYLGERGVDDELAEFLHECMANKDKAEMARWLRTVESYIQK